VASCGAVSLKAGIDAPGARGDFQRHYDKLIGAFGGTEYHVTDKSSLSTAVTDALRPGKPAIINVVIDPTAGTESGHIQTLNPKVALAE
jgi:oxalyl-CoA decarboxylase